MPVPLLAWLILIPSRALSRSPPLIPPPFIPLRRRFPLLLCHLRSSLRCSAPLPRCSPSRSTAATVPFQIEQTAARRWRNRADGGEETAESSRQRRGEGRIKRNRRGDGGIEGGKAVELQRFATLLCSPPSPLSARFRLISRARDAFPRACTFPVLSPAPAFSYRGHPRMAPSLLDFDESDAKSTTFGRHGSKADAIPI